MKRTGRRSEVAVSLAVVAVFAALWVLEFGIGAPPEPGNVASVVVVALVAAPWLIAARLLWQGWWARNAATVDGPGWPLAAAVATLPPTAATGVRR